MSVLSEREKQQLHVSLKKVGLLPAQRLAGGTRLIKEPHLGQQNMHKKAQKDLRTNQAEPHYEPTVEQIQVRAYEIYIQRGRTDGFDLNDWLQAEKELKTSGQNRSRY
jgi:hypothetical protein